MSNALVLSRQLLCDLLAASTTFRTVVGAANSAAASLQIKSPYAGDDAANAGRRARLPMPRAIINRGDEWEDDKLGTGWGRSTGNLVISLQFLPDPAANGDPDDELDAFELLVGNIIDELKDRSASDMLAGENVRSQVTGKTHINLTKVALLALGEGEQKNENGQLWYGAIIVVWFV